MKRGRPLVDGKPRSEVIKVYVTGADAEKVDDKRGEKSRSAWVRDVIRKELR
jgi:hypothetical protein